MGTGSQLPGDASYGRVGAVVVAAGQSTRMAGQDKIFATVAGQPLLAYAVEALERSPSIQQICPEPLRIS